MVHDGLAKLVRAIIQPLFYNHQKSLVKTESHLRILSKKFLYLGLFKRIYFGGLHTDRIGGIETVLDHCRPAERKPGFDGSNDRGNLV